MDGKKTLAGFLFPNFFIRIFEALGSKVLNLFHGIKNTLHFVLESLRQAFRKPFRGRLIIQQMEFIGSQSLTIVLICSFFIGAALSLQVATIFVIFGAEGMVGAANAKALSRELSPLITGFLLAGRVGASITAELATMKVNEQIDAMEAMAVDPISYLVVPRFIAGVVMLPFLVGIFNVIGQVASLLVAVSIFDIDQAVFFGKMVQVTEARDVIHGLEKAVIFGGIITLLSCQFGLNAKGGAKGVGRATTNSVVTILLVLLAVDFIITYIQIAT